jgi:hypothetical protein
LNIFKASKCKGVHTSCIPIGDISWAALSADGFAMPHCYTIAFDMIGGTVKPPAIVTVSLAKKIM